MNIRFAKYSDKSAILDFIDRYWAKDHIFVNWPELFDYTHLLNNGDLAYVIAEDEKVQKIYGVCGYIISNHLEHPDIWVALWKVIPSGLPSLGMDLINFMKENTKCRVFSCCGIKNSVKRIYNFLGFHTGTLNHFYRLADKEAYQVACVNQKNIIPATPNKGCHLEEIKTKAQFEQIFNFEILTRKKPYKDKDYLIHRYFENIGYQYKIWTIMFDGSSVANSVLIGREIRQNNAVILRLVDFLGIDEELEQIAVPLQKLIETNGYEYIDMYEYGLKDETMYKMGMTKREKTDTNIIPNYFEPFVQENVDIHFFTNAEENFYMFKADGDQDRPNSRP